MKKMMFAMLSLLSAATAYGGDAVPGDLSGLHFMWNGVVLVSTSGQRSGVPSCASAHSARFALNATTDAGKVQLAGLLSAHAAGKQVGIIGTGNCAVYGDSESISYFHIAD
jgi:hypothetical protein